MNDLDEIRDMRSEVPAPTWQRLAAGRTRMVASIAGPSRTRSPLRGFLPIGLAAAAVGVAKRQQRRSARRQPITRPR
jgi:hypothetical protein